jgi:hypothetical protein
LRVISLIMHTDGRIEMLTESDPWSLVRIEASEDLEHWQTVHVRTTVLNPVAFTEDATRFRQRFYRAIASR